MLRKIFKTGNSLVVSFPKDILEPLGMHEGMDVLVELDLKNHQILLRPVKTPLFSDLTEVFLRRVNKFNEEYRPDLEALAYKYTISLPNKLFLSIPFGQ